VDSDLRQRLETFVRPLYQELDGVSRFEEVERIAGVARSLHRPPDPRAFELLLLFQGLGKWLPRVGNISRVVLAIPSIREAELQQTAASLRRLESPESDDERALAAAMLIDRAGVHGLAQRFAHARREGHSVIDVVREALAGAWIPDWVPASARPLLEDRFEARRRVCGEILDELSATSGERRPADTPARR
jgi:hypothetical protein